MRSPWFRSYLSVGARAAVLLILVVALLLPVQQEKHRGIHAALLIDHASELPPTTLDRLVSDIGSTTALAVDHGAAGLQAAMQNALWEFDPDMQGAIIIASEGHWDPDVVATLRQARSASIPVFWISLPPVDDAPRVLTVRAPDRARAGQRIGVAVEIHAARPVDVVLLGNNGPAARAGSVQSGTINFQINVPDGGPLILGAEIRDISSGDIISRLSQGSLVNVAVPPSVLVVTDGPSMFGESLRNGGWSVTELSPRSLSGRNDILRSFACLVLDDVAASDLPGNTWVGISNAVRHDAMGLLVLGGPHSFGLGAYRGSQLESLLPVISEPPERESPASLVFLVDVSGSMDRAGATNQRLQIARQAVLETAKALRPADRVGLITFDIEAKELLSPASRADHAKSIEQVWPEQASGGTRLMPALRRAVDALQQHDSKQKLLVLLTDGFLPREDLDQLEDALRNTDVELIVMIIDDGSQLDNGPLARFADADRMRIIRIDDVLRLPTLMRSEIESRRPALMTQQSRPELASPAAWLPDDVTWPIVDAYLVTRPRDEARVHLTAENGDVLVAGINAGAGKVVVVTSGLSDWTTRWLQWKHWPEFAARLTNFIATRSASNVDITAQQNTVVKTELIVELEDRKLPDTSFVATLVDPSGELGAIDLKSQGPGQLGANLLLNSIGQYTLTVDDGSVTTGYRFLNHPKDTRLLHEPAIAKTWLNDGLLQLWQPESLRKLQDEADWRTRLFGLALLSFLLLLLVERLPQLKLSGISRLALRHTRFYTWVKSPSKKVLT